MTEKNRDFLLVAAIDIGTTYSGDAYSMKDTYKTNPLTIHANQAWNADGRTVLPLKTPTSLLLNSKKEFDSFGYEAENKYAELVMVGEQDNYYYFHGFKIDMLNNKNEDSDMMLKDITGKIVPAIDVFALSIKALVNHLMYTLTQGTGVTLDDIQWVLTVPAIWTDNLMQFMRTSSEKAGLKRDHLLVLKESEAAALFCQHLPIEKLRGAKYGFKMSKLRTTYMIVDLGGATVDVTVQAQLFGGGIKEFCCRTNGGCGGTSVDTSFIHMFENIFGKPLLNTMKREHPLVYLELLREFETVKMTIIPTKTGKINIKVPFPTLDALCKTHLQKDVTSTVLESTYSSSISIRGDKMRIEEKLFKSFFDTTIKCILEMLQEMIERIGFSRIVTSIILVGSFSECSLVQETIRKTFSTRNVIVPEDSGLAVLKGAVIYGHRKMINSEFDDNDHVDHSEYFDIQKMDSTKRHPPLVDENATLSDDSSSESSSVSSDENTPLCTKDVEDDSSSESSSVSSDENAPLCTKDVEDLKTSIPYVPFKEDILLNFNYTEREPMPLFSTIAEENRENNDGQKEISETAINTCETILVGFEMLTSDCILRNGDIAIENFDQTENARQMRKELEKNKILWQHQSTPEAIRLKQVAGVLDAIEKGDYTEILKLYYRAQHQHTFSDKDRPLEIPVYIHENQLDSKWIPHVEHAIEAINTVTPGINLYKTSNKDRSMIRIGVDSEGESKQAYTTNGSILDKRQNKEYKRPFIHLGGKWNESQMKGTSIHELMHALSFHHEMQRFDNDMYVDIGENVDHNFKKKEDKVLTRFDPFSVMMYPEGNAMKRKEGDPIWKLKQTRERCQDLSELNKVALNLKYKPCMNKSKGYSPKLSLQTEMLYCRRQVMITHNQVGKSTTDGFCGPNNWANCPACRVFSRVKDNQKQSIEIPKLKKCLGKGKWQGLSGLFYCGKKDRELNTDLKHLKSDGICGPDTGVPCNGCGEELFNGYSIESCDNIFKPRHRRNKENVF